MAYSSVRGRKPMERASKISHAQVINDIRVKALLQECTLPEPAAAALVEKLAVPIEPASTTSIRGVVAIDGGYQETPVREQYPSASISFFTFGPLFFRLQDLRDLDASPFLAPEDLARLKQLQRFSLALPTRNISRNGMTLQRSVRLTLHEFFAGSGDGAETLLGALRWLLFREWDAAAPKVWTLPSCPNRGCQRGAIGLTPASPDVDKCSSCGGPIYIVDALRLHERIDDDQGAGGVLGYIMTALEHLVLVHLIKVLWSVKPTALREVMFIKDGPLGFFGMTAPLSGPMREMATYMGGKTGPNADHPLLNVVGLEKSGAFVDHAIQIEDRLAPGSALVLTNDYVYTYVIPGDPHSPDPYGKNTYWGSKLIYRARDGNTYVATVPTGDFNPAPQLEDFINVSNVLSVVGSLRCSMYDNALIPIALVNKLVSLSDFPSGRILEAFAKAAVG